VCVCVCSLPMNDKSQAQIIVLNPGVETVLAGTYIMSNQSLILAEVCICVCACVCVHVSVCVCKYTYTHLDSHIHLENVVHLRNLCLLAEQIF
jgi:hypothetical protein